MCVRRDHSRPSTSRATKCTTDNKDWTNTHIQLFTNHEKELFIIFCARAFTAERGGGLWWREENDSYPVGNTAYDRDWSYGPDDGYCTGPYKAVVHILNVDEVDTIFVKLINIAAYTDYTFPCLSDRVWLNKHDLGEQEVHLYDTVHFYITAIKYWGAYITSACSFYCIVKPLNEGETTDTINWRY